MKKISLKDNIIIIIINSTISAVNIKLFSKNILNSSLIKSSSDYLKIYLEKVPFAMNRKSVIAVNAKKIETL